MSTAQYANLELTCGACGRVHTVSSTLLGKVGRCPCGATFRVELEGGKTELPSPPAPPPPPPPRSDPLLEGHSRVLPSWMAPCPDCGHALSRRASVCPRCGHRAPPPFHIMGCVVFFLLFGIGTVTSAAQFAQGVEILNDSRTVMDQQLAYTCFLISAVTGVGASVMLAIAVIMEASIPGRIKFPKPAK